MDNLDPRSLTTEQIASIIKTSRRNNPAQICLVNTKGIHYKYYIITIYPRENSNMYDIIISYGRIDNTPRGRSALNHTTFTANDFIYNKLSGQASKGYKLLDITKFCLKNKGFIDCYKIMGVGALDPKDKKKALCKKAALDKKQAEIHNRFKDLIF